MSGVAQRTLARRRHHYEVERELAARLRDSTRAERTALYGELYDELFRRVPDHPRLTRRDDGQESARSVQARMRLLQPFLTPETTMLEIASGDCRLAYAACAHCRHVTATDISDQRAPDEVTPDNFGLVLYDGYDLTMEDNSVDVVFSYQFLEHLHPDDVDHHFDVVTRVLKPGGVYVFDTPHLYSGPHDISAEFSKELDCFHFQEWTFRTLARSLEKRGFARVSPIRRGRLLSGAVEGAAYRGLEATIGLLPRALRQRVSRRLFPSVALAAEKS